MTNALWGADFLADTCDNDWPQVERGAMKNFTHTHTHVEMLSPGRCANKCAHHIHHSTYYT